MGTGVGTGVGTWIGTWIGTRYGTGGGTAEYAGERASFPVPFMKPGPLSNAAVIPGVASGIPGAGNGGSPPREGGWDGGGDRPRCYRPGRWAAAESRDSTPSVGE
ncbi:hypothetical protein GCM10027160_52280 [Streptomyces calidiresistens]